MINHGNVEVKCGGRPLASKMTAGEELKWTLPEGLFCRRSYTADHMIYSTPEITSIMSPCNKFSNKNGRKLRKELSSSAGKNKIPLKSLSDFKHG